MRIAILASGNGSNAEALVKALTPAVKLIFSDHHDAGVLARADRLGVPADSFELKEFDSKNAYEQQLVSRLTAENIDLVLLAGYMKIISETFLKAYENKIINIHPSLLPEFAGSPHAIEDSWQAQKGCGVTVHWVDAGLDTGKIIAQRPVKWLDSLEDYEKSLHDVEHALYPEVVKNLL